MKTTSHSKLKIGREIDIFNDPLKVDNEEKFTVNFSSLSTFKGYLKMSFSRPILSVLCDVVFIVI